MTINGFFPPLIQFGSAPEPEPAVHMGETEGLGDSVSIAALTSTDSADFSAFFWFDPATGNTIELQLMSILGPQGLNITGGSIGEPSSLNILIAGEGRALQTRTENLNPVNLWHPILISAKTDLSAGNKIIKVYDGDEDITGTITDPDASFIVQTNGSAFDLGNLSASENGINFAFVWIAPGQTLLTGSDIPEATRRKFYDAGGNPVDLGANGQIPTGVAPRIYMHGGPADFAVNHGTGGAITATTGTPTEVPGPPS